MTGPAQEQQEPCMDCVLAASPSQNGLCYRHASKIMKENLKSLAHSDTFTTFSFNVTLDFPPITKQECLEQIAILTRQLLKLKWYQFKQKQYTKGELRIWMRDYDNILRAE